MVADLPPELDAEPRVRSRLSADEFMALCESGVFGDLARVELLDGELVEMPREGNGHSINNFQTGRVLDRLVARYPDLDIGANMAILLGPGRVVGPDMVVFKPLPERPTLTPASAVRLAVEHAWSSRWYDLNRKADLYAAAGVPEYWVLDNADMTLHRFHTPRSGAYARDPPMGLDAHVAVPFAPGETVRVGELFRLG